MPGRAGCGLQRAESALRPRLPLHSMYRSGLPRPAAGLPGLPCGALLHQQVGAGSYFLRKAGGRRGRHEGYLPVRPGVDAEDSSDVRAGAFSPLHNQRPGLRGGYYGASDSPGLRHPDDSRAALRHRQHLSGCTQAGGGAHRGGSCERHCDRLSTRNVAGSVYIRPEEQDHSRARGMHGAGGIQTQGRRADNMQVGRKLRN